MDRLFWVHDQDHNDIGDDIALLSGLKALPTMYPTPSIIWGRNIYVSSETGLEGGPPASPIWVSRVSWFGGGSTFRWFWSPMPYSEYSRREAVLGMTALIWGRSLFNVNGM
jgi:hypothetical protein